MVNWDCWLSDEAGGNQVQLSGKYQPLEIPLPEREWIGSKIPLLAPGSRVIQSAGFGEEKLTVPILVEYSKWLLIEALLNRVVSGEHKSCRFFNSYETYLVKPVGSLRPKRSNNRNRPLISVTLEFEIISTL